MISSYFERSRRSLKYSYLVVRPKVDGVALVPVSIDLEQVQGVEAEEELTEQRRLLGHLELDVRNVSEVPVPGSKSQASNRHGEAGGLPSRNGHVQPAA